MPCSLRSGLASASKRILDQGITERTQSSRESAGTISSLHPTATTNHPVQSLSGLQTKASSAFLEFPANVPRDAPNTSVQRKTRFKFGKRYGCYHPGCKFSRSSLAELSRHFSPKVDAHPGTSWDRTLAIELYMEDPKIPVDENPEVDNVADSQTTKPVNPSTTETASDIHAPSALSPKRLSQVAFEYSASSKVVSTEAGAAQKSKEKRPAPSLNYDILPPSLRLAKKRQRDDQAQKEGKTYSRVIEDEDEGRAKRPRTTAKSRQGETRLAGVALPKESPPESPPKSPPGVTQSTAPLNTGSSRGKHDPIIQKSTHNQFHEKSKPAYSHTPLLEGELRMVIAGQADKIRSANERVAEAHKVAVQCEQERHELAASVGEKNIEIASLLRNVGALAEALVKERQTARERYQDVEIQKAILNIMNKEQSGRLAALVVADANQKTYIAQLERSVKTLSTRLSTLENINCMMDQKTASSSQGSVANGLMEERTNHGEGLECGGEVKGVEGTDGAEGVGGADDAIKEECTD